MLQSLLSNKVLIVILVIEILCALVCGVLLAGFFACLSANWAGSDFEWDFETMFAGCLLGAVIIGPAINAIVLLLTRHFKGALIALLIAIAGYLLCYRVIPYFQNVNQAKADAAPAEEIAQRAIDTVKREKNCNNSIDFIYFTDCQLLNHEGCSVRLDATKTKEVVDCTAKLIAEDESLSPRITKYGWRTISYSSGTIYYAMVMYPEDGGYMVLFSMQPEDWEQIGHATPQLLESDLRNRMLKKNSK